MRTIRSIAQAASAKTNYGARYRSTVYRPVCENLVRRLALKSRRLRDLETGHTATGSCLIKAMQLPRNVAYILLVSRLNFTLT